MATLADVLFVGVNSRIAALDKRTGELLWSWRAPRGSGFVTLLVEGAHVYASVNGYTYCIEAASGRELWGNPLEGFGFGVAALAVVGSSSRHDHLGAAAASQAAAAAVIASQAATAS